MKKTKLMGMLLPCLMLMASFFSCSNEEITSNKTEKKTTLRISLNVNESRSNAYITADQTDKEKDMGGVVVGIFDKDGKVRTITTFESFSGSVDVTTSNLVETDTVIVAINPPSLNLFSGVQKLADFKAKTCTYDNVLSKVGGSNNYSFPMIGQTNPTKSDNTWSASVTAKRLVSKITLESLKVTFDENGAYYGASLTPKEIYLLNVPEYVKFDASSYIANTNFFTGNSSTSGFKDYLGTGALAQTELNSENTDFANKLYFYTLPNNSTTNPTKLVIKALFKSNDEDTGTDVYYPVIINRTDDGTAIDGNVSTVGFNKNYKLSITIKTKGVATETETMDKQTAAVTLTVDNFIPISQSNTFE